MATILKVIGSGLGLWAIFVLWPAFLLFVISVLLAVTLNPAVLWMERRGIGRRVGVIVIAALAIGLLAAFVAFLLPPLTVQLAHLARDFPDFRARIVSRIPTRYPAVQNLTRALFESPSYPTLGSLLERSFG